jgi:NAD(P)-dependent dehydrogenase (short-subunit alcohol dehydrogenase family)
VVILTGAGGPIGKVYARRLLEAGASVVLAELPNAFPAAIKELTAASGNTLYVPTDVRDVKQTGNLIDQTLEKFGRADVLINNAALFSTLARGPMENLEPADWEKVLSVNVIGAFNCIRAVTPVMKKQGAGKIINVATNAVHKGMPMLLHYVASKGAVLAMTRSLARELGPSGITCNAIAPGYVFHEGTSPSDGGRNEIVKTLRSLGKTETPDDLAGTILFLCSAASDFISGQTIIVDGGEVFL